MTQEGARPPIVFGLTGGISSGKSAVAALLRARGVAVVDADQVARDVVAPGQPALAELVAAFGPEIVDASGALNRKALGARAFADPAARQTLNRITHPRIAAATRRMIEELTAKGAPFVVYEAALLVENQLHRALDGLIVVRADEAVQIARTQARDGLTSAEALARVRAQAPLEEKLAAASWVIDNRGSLDDLGAQVDTLCRALTEKSQTR
jgi:dephospho-CoA kinase